MNEFYARVFWGLYKIETVGLRYFNVFGPRQNPNGAYAAVIPRWVESCLRSEECTIFGDGKTSRDFCFVKNVVMANILAALAAEKAAGQVFNVACGGETDLNELHSIISGLCTPGAAAALRHEAFRPGDVRHSKASIDKARALLGYTPEITVRQGLEIVVSWYRSRLRGG